MKYFTVINFLLCLIPAYVRCSVRPLVLVHGGADDQYDVHTGRKQGVKKAAMAGHKILQKGGSVVNAVEEAIKILENNEAFNAGYGSALNTDGDIEMDACIMLGSNLSSGGVTGIKNVANPISAARLVMERSPHCLLAGEGAKRFVKDHGMPLVPTYTLMAPHVKEDLAEALKAPGEAEVGSGGVGAIALDEKGRMAAAASSGGRIAKLPGRGSDVSIVGAGLYVDDDVGAAVATGHGEAIARYVLAHEIINAMKRGFEAGVATRNAVKGITEKFHKPTGAITVSKVGHIGISFTTEKMAWAYQVGDDIHYGVDDYDHASEKIKI